MLLAAAGGMAGLVPALIATARPAWAFAYNIEISDNAYSPKVQQINKGDKVVWRMPATKGPHSATSDDGDFDYKFGSKGAVEELRFTAPGKYSYHCTYHDGMTGTIVVNDPDAPTTTTTAPPTTTTTARPTTTTTTAPPATTTTAQPTTTTGPPRPPAEVAPARPQYGRGAAADAGDVLDHDGAADHRDHGCPGDDDYGAARPGRRSGSPLLPRRLRRRRPRSPRPAVPVRIRRRRPPRRARRMASSTEVP